MAQVSSPDARGEVAEAVGPLTALTSVVIPAFNEEQAIAPLVAELLAVSAWQEIIVVDAGSNDETAARASAAGARVLRQPDDKGSGAAVKTGIRHAAGASIPIIHAGGPQRPAAAVPLVP